MLRAALTLLLVLVVAAPAQAAPGWAPGAPMHTARWLHAAVLLDDGRVLVAGGHDASQQSSASAEVYDPRTGAWTPTGAMHEARAGHVMVKLGDGRVLAAGGRLNGATPVASAELYDPATGRWVGVRPMGSARSMPAAVRLADGSVLVAGGHVGGSTYSGTSERFDPGSQTWSTPAPFGPGRAGADVATLPDGRVLLAGGGDQADYMTSAYVYSPAADGWAATAPMTHKRFVFSLNALPGGRVLAVAGAPASGLGSRTSEVFDPAKGLWSDAAPLASERGLNPAVTLADGKVLAAGGYHNGLSITSAELYDPVRGVWEPAGTLGLERRHATVTVLADGRALVAGGYANSAPNTTAATELFTPLTALTADPALTFTDRAVGTGADSGVNVTNVGGTPLLVDGATLLGPHPGDFVVHGTACRVVAPGATCALPVRFAPTADGVRSATLRLSTNTSGGTHAIALSGRGVADRDGDGVLDSADRCATRKGPASRSGCPKGLLADPSIAYRRVKGGIKVVAYYVKATTGARVTVKCSRGCKRTTTKGKGAKRVRITRLNGKRLKNGTKIAITVSKPGRLTTTVTDRITKSRRIEGRPRCTPVGC